MLWSLSQNLPIFQGCPAGILCIQWEGALGWAPALPSDVGFQQHVINSVFAEPEDWVGDFQSTAVLPVQRVSGWGISKTPGGREPQTRQAGGAGFCFSSQAQLVQGLSLEKGCFGKPNCAGCVLGSLGDLTNTGAFKLAVELAPSPAPFLSSWG